MSEINDIFKSIRVGTVDFFGILIPGLLAVVFMAVGCFLPLSLVFVNVMGIKIPEILSNTTFLAFGVFVIIVYAYVLGYILRLSSPDILDRISARNVIIQELARLDEQAQQERWKKKVQEKEIEKKGKNEGKKDAREEKKEDKRRYKVGFFYKYFAGYPILQKLAKWIASKKMFDEEERFRLFVKLDGWPYDPNDPMDKYPYFNFRNYLHNRGHTDAEGLVKWGNEQEVQRSKTIINELKMWVRVKRPDLSAMLESKEGHIRLMSGTWSAFRLALWPVVITLGLVLGFAIDLEFLHWCSYYAFIEISLLFLILYSLWRIEQLFHYRRVNELFHIVQAACIAEVQPLLPEDNEEKK